MRDAFGGVFMIQLMMVFLVIYICFLAVGYNYAKAFRTKNVIVDYIERYEGYNNRSRKAINNYLDKVIKYNVAVEADGNYKSNHPNAYCDKRGYCVERINNDGRTGYRVTTFIPINIFGIGRNLITHKMSIPSISITSEVQTYSPYYKDFNNIFN